MELTKKIAIIEIDYHPEVLRNTLIIFNNLPIKCNVFTTEKIWKQVNLDKTFSKITPYLLDKKKNARSFFLFHLKKINQSDLIFFNTIASKFKLFNSLNFSAPILLRIHNANAYLNPLKNIDPKFSSFYIWKDTSYLVLKVVFNLEMYYRKLFINKVDYFCFPSDQVTEYVKSKKFVVGEKIVNPIPFAFFGGKQLGKQPAQHIVISIIGRIDKRTRNYSEVLKAFELIIPKLNQMVELKFLGKPVGIFGKKIIRKFNKLECNKFKFTYFNSYVPQTEFDKHLQSTHFLVIPTFKDTRYKIFKELYGFTKISGNANDMIIYGKPAIIPSFYPLPKEFIPNVNRYSGVENLSNSILDWINNEQYLNFDFSEIMNLHNLEQVQQKVWENLTMINGFNIKGL